MLLLSSSGRTLANRTLVGLKKSVTACADCPRQGLRSPQVQHRMSLKAYSFCCPAQTPSALKVPGTHRLKPLARGPGSENRQVDWLSVPWSLLGRWNSNRGCFCLVNKCSRMHPRLKEVYIAPPDRLSGSLQTVSTDSQGFAQLLGEECDDFLENILLCLELYNSCLFFFFPHIWNLELSARIWGCLKWILRFIRCCCLSFLHPGVTSHPFKHNWWFFIVSKASSPFTFWPRSFSCCISFSCPQYALSFTYILSVSFSQPISLVYLFAFLSPPLPGKPFGNVGYLRKSPSPKAASSLKLLRSLPQLKWCSMLSEPVLCTQAIGLKKKSFI